MEEYDNKLEDLKSEKPWITESERKDVKDKMTEILEWLKQQMEEQSKLELYEDPTLKSNEVLKKMANLQLLFKKISNKKKPKAKKLKVTTKDFKMDEDKKEDKKEDPKTEDEAKSEDQSKEKTEDASKSEL